MYKLKRLFNIYKKQIIIGAIAVIAFVIILQILNNNVKIKNQEVIKKDDSRIIEAGKDHTIISGEIKNEIVYKKEITVLQKFVDFCNNKNYEEAYNMISDNCKEVLYPTIDIFKTNYCDVNFDRKKTCKFQSWNSGTYKVDIRIDAMSTGGYTKDYIQDYYTVLFNDKINISGYIERKKINKEKEVDNVVVKVNNIDSYIDFTKVNCTITNATDKQILIDPQINENTLVLKDNNNLEFFSNINEFNKDELIMDSMNKKDIILKFEVGYRDKLVLESIKFNKILKIIDSTSIESGAFKTIKIEVNML